MVTDYSRIGKAKTTEISKASHAPSGRVTKLNLTLPRAGSAVGRGGCLNYQPALRESTNESPAPSIRNLRHQDAIRIVGRK